MSSGSSRVARLQIRGAERDTPALRLRISSCLGNAELRPPGLGPSAILFVRRLADPLPGRLVRRGAVLPDPAWERAAQEKLAALARRAARPSRGPVPAEAEAVLFSDDAEMLAGLALDVAAGEPAGRWWWAAVRHSLPWQLPALLIEKARELPAMAFHWWSGGWEREVLAALTPPEAMAVFEALAETHGVNALRPPVAEAGEPRGDNSADRPPLPGAEAPSPWRTWLPPAQIRSWPRAWQALLGLALALHRSPSRVRSLRFGREVERWWGSPESEAAQERGSWGRPHLTDPSDPSDPSDRSDEADASPTGEEDGGRAEGAPPPGREGHTVHPEGVPDGSAPTGRGRAMAGRNRSERRNAPPGSAGVPPAHTSFWGAEGPPPKFERAGRPRSQGKAAPSPQGKFLESRGSAGWSATFCHRSAVELLPEGVRAPLPISAEPQLPSPIPPELPAEEATTAWADDGLSTRLGGILYLINLIEALDLLDRWEREEPELAAHAGAWGLLEMLARTLLAEHLAEFADDPLWPALAELGGRAANDRLDPALSPWLLGTLPEIHQRLAEALGREPDDEIVPALLLTPARVYVTSSHVDLVASLEQISLAARLSGLDRDPGWLPRFGRVVLFHFE